MDAQTQLFLDFTLSGSSKVDAYKLAFEPDSNIKDSSLETYAKRILAQAESKKYLSDRKITNSTQSYELMQAVKYLNGMLEGDALSAINRIHTLREKRQTIADLCKLIEVVIPSNRLEDEFIVSDCVFKLHTGENIKSISAEDALSILKDSKGGNVLSIDNKGNIIQVLPLIGGSKDINLRHAVASGNFRICVKKSDLEKGEKEELEF